MSKKCECAAHSAAECCCGAWDELDYKALWEQMCQRCDELDAKLAEAEKQEPVGWLDGNDQLAEFMHKDLKAEHDKRGSSTPNLFPIPVYTHPQPKREPLTDEATKLRGEIGVLVGLLGAALQVIETVDGEDAAECEALMELQNKITYAIQGAST